jgi:tetratricopeptide (TPR) repeat protein
MNSTGWLPRGNLGGLGRAYLEMGMYTKGVEEIQLAVRLSGESVGMLAALAHAYGLAGKTEKARGILGDLAERSRRSYVPPTSIAVIYAGLGEKENALEWLEKAWGEQDVGLHTLTLVQIRIRDWEVKKAEHLVA